MRDLVPDRGQPHATCTIALRVLAIGPPEKSTCLCQVGCLSFLLRFFLSGGPCLPCLRSFISFLNAYLSLLYEILPCTPASLFMSLYSPALLLSLLSGIHPSIHRLSCCSSAKNTRHPQPPPSQDTPHPCGPSPCPGAVLVSLSIFSPTSLPLCPSSPEMPPLLQTPPITQGLPSSLPPTPPPQ